MEIAEILVSVLFNRMEPQTGPLSDLPAVAEAARCPLPPVYCTSANPPLAATSPSLRRTWPPALHPRPPGPDPDGPRMRRCSPPPARCARPPPPCPLPPPAARNHRGHRPPDRQPRRLAPHPAADAGPALRQRSPGIQIELVPSDTTENLLFREADIAMRMCPPHPARPGRPSSGRPAHGPLRRHDLSGPAGSPDTPRT